MAAMTDLLPLCHALISGYKLGACLLVSEVDEFSEMPAQSFLVSQCFTDMSGGFFQYEKQEFSSTDCSGSAMELRNISEVACDLQFECVDAVAAPWVDSPAVTAL